MHGQKEKILVVDDEPFSAELLCDFLSMEGYRCAMASSGEEALKLVAGDMFDLLVTDINMPGMSGIDLLKAVRTLRPDTAVLMVSGISDRQTAIHALRLGAYGYCIKPIDCDELIINVTNALERRRVTLLTRQYERDLEQKVRERTAQLRRREDQIIFRLVSAAEYRDDETGGHIRRIGLYSGAIAGELGWASQTVHDLQVAAPMHDVGKIGIPDIILRKPKELTRDEFEIMKTHAEIGGKILYDPDIPLLMTAREIALSHHEKWDGSGYPKGLAGEDIPESGRIVAVVDVYDALVSARVYRPPLPEEQALSIISGGKGRHFDPRIVDCFFSMLPEMRRIRERVNREEEHE